MDESIPSNRMISDITTLGLVSAFCARFCFASEDDFQNTSRLIDAFGFTPEQGAAIRLLMRVSMEED